MINGLAVRVEGAGPPVLLLHAGVADHRSWDAVAAAMSPTYTVIRPDFRGFGASPAPTAAFRHLDDLVAVLDELGVDAAAVAGNSFGGGMALELAGARPGRVSRLAMLAAPLFGQGWSDPMREYLAAEEKALAADDLDTAVQLNLDMWVRGPVRDWSPELRRLADQVAGPMRIAVANQTAAEEHELEDEHEPIPGRLAEVSVPTLVGVGDQDLPDFVAFAERMVAEMPDAELVRFPGAGHLIPVEQPEQVADQLIRFFGS